MPLSRVRITALRCLVQVEIDLHAERNYLFGPNGAGKTSVLEGMFLLGRGRSFRTRQIRRLVQRGTAGFAVFGDVHTGERRRKLGVAYANGRLEKRIDGEAATGMAALAEILPIHVIDPGVHELIEGGPSERRRLLDWGVFHVEQAYLEAWKRYRRILGHRNAVLKTARTSAELGSWTAALAEAGEDVSRRRRTYVEQLAGAVAQEALALRDQPLALDYVQGWPEGLSLAEALGASQSRDRVSGSTEVGPHRADLRLNVEGRRVQDEASRGQQKLTAAALILGQTAVHASVHGGGLLLVDDPAAELDAQSLERLLASLERAPGQLVLTGLTDVQVSPRAGFPVFHVEHGEVWAV